MNSLYPSKKKTIDIRQRRSTIEDDTNQPKWPFQDGVFLFLLHWVQHRNTFFDKM